ncbi:MAG: hypothetical protein ABII90_05585 [Bacteroidota bacterium]
MSYIHKNLAAGRWYELSLIEQMANIGSEVHRTFQRYKEKDTQRFQSAFERALELFDLTLNDKRWGKGRKEIARCREFFCDFFVGENEYNFTAGWFEKYFMEFAIAAQMLRYKNITS